jgi:hypothetical protein
MTCYIVRIVLCEEEDTWAYMCHTYMRRRIHASHGRDLLYSWHSTGCVIWGGGYMHLMDVTCYIVRIAQLVSSCIYIHICNPFYRYYSCSTLLTGYKKQLLHFTTRNNIFIYVDIISVNIFWDLVYIYILYIYAYMYINSCSTTSPRIFTHIFWDLVYLHTCSET